MPKNARTSRNNTILADIVVVAAGHPNLIVAPMIRTGAVVIECRHQPSARWARLVGDVDFDGVRKKASHITPVPGGVGPMTVTMLLDNTVAAAERGEQRRASRSRQPSRCFPAGRFPARLVVVVSSQPLMEAVGTNAHSPHADGGTPYEILAHCCRYFRFVLGLASPLAAQTAALAEGAYDFTTLEAPQNARQCQARPAHGAGRVIPVPQTASPQMQASMGRPYRAPCRGRQPRGAANGISCLRNSPTLGAAHRPAAR